MKLIIYICFFLINKSESLSVNEFGIGCLLIMSSDKIKRLFKQISNAQIAINFPDGDN